jgi:hypothetical protein
VNPRGATLRINLADGRKTHLRHARGAANGLDPWLHAAGFERIEALDEVLC